VTFEQQIVQWQTFFTTVATVAATLVGLLFVSLSINREKITAEANRVLLRIAQRSFSDFIIVLLIALFFLIPEEGSRALAIELLGLAAFRLRRLAVQVMKHFRGGQPMATGGWLMEYLLPAFTIAGLAASGIGIYLEKPWSLYYCTVPVIAILLVRASSNAWLLLIMENR
jgi:hypothetical protein